MAATEVIRVLRHVGIRAGYHISINKLNKAKPRYVLVQSKIDPYDVHFANRALMSAAELLTI